MSRGKAKDPRSRPCDAADAHKRLGDAEKYLDVAELVATEDSLESHNVATGLAVLAGIAAADAACCKTLGESSRGPDHQDAAIFHCLAVLRRSLRISRSAVNYCANGYRRAISRGADSG
jgi:hypothetical protein